MYVHMMEASSVSRQFFLFYHVFFCILYTVRSPDSFGNGMTEKDEHLTILILLILFQLNVEFHIKIHMTVCKHDNYYLFVLENRNA